MRKKEIVHPQNRVLHWKLLIQIVSKDSWGLGQVKSRFGVVNKERTLKTKNSDSSLLKFKAQTSITVPKRGEECQLRWRHTAILDAKYKVEKIFYLLWYLFSLVLGRVTDHGYTGMIYTSDYWNNFLELVVPTFISLRDSDSPKDIQQSVANLLNRTQDILTFLFGIKYF